MANFDTKTFGKNLQKIRKEHGFKSAEKFADAVQRETGVTLTKDVLNKIEQGRQEISLPQYLAVCKVLFGCIMPNQMYMTLFECLSADWQTDEAIEMSNAYDEALFSIADFFSKVALVNENGPDAMKEPDYYMNLMEKFRGHNRTI